MVTRQQYPATVGGMIEWCVAELDRGGAFFGHGTNNCRDEAASLVFAVAGLGHEEAGRSPAAAYRRELAPGCVSRIAALLQRRIDERVPLPYLLKEAWFAGLPFYVDERVLIPRSPFAELIEARFAPWLTPAGPRRILEIGTGSGCIAVALALAFPDSCVVAADLMPEALDVARINIERHGVDDRVELVQSDLFTAVTGRFDLIVSNPPYVPAGDVAELPREYAHEPLVALISGADGLDSSRRILQDAARYLTADGWLAVEVGAGSAALEAAFPSLPFVWPEIEFGGEGIALIQAAGLSGGEMV